MSASNVRGADINLAKILESIGLSQAVMAQAREKDPNWDGLPSPDWVLPAEDELEGLLPALGDQNEDGIVQDNIVEALSMDKTPNRRHRGDSTPSVGASTSLAGIYSPPPGIPEFDFEFLGPPPRGNILGFPGEHGPHHSTNIESNSNALFAELNAKDDDFIVNGDPTLKYDKEIDFLFKGLASFEDFLESVKNEVLDGPAKAEDNSRFLQTETPANTLDYSKEQIASPAASVQQGLHQDPQDFTFGGDNGYAAETRNKEDDIKSITQAGINGTNTTTFRSHVNENINHKTKLVPQVVIYVPKKSPKAKEPENVSEASPETPNMSRSDVEKSQWAAEQMRRKLIVKMTAASLGNSKFEFLGHRTRGGARARQKRLAGRRNYRAQATGSKHITNARGRKRSKIVYSDDNEDDCHDYFPDHDYLDEYNSSECQLSITTHASSKKQKLEKKLAEGLQAAAMDSEKNMVLPANYNHANVERAKHTARASAGRYRLGRYEGQPREEWAKITLGEVIE